MGKVLEGYMLAREDLAALAHAQWTGWMEHVFKKSEIQPDGTCIIPKWAVENWKRQMKTRYTKLTEEEKDCDRKEADKVLVLLGYLDKK